MSPEELAAWHTELHLMRSAREGRAAVIVLSVLGKEESRFLSNQSPELRKLQKMADDLLFHPCMLPPGRKPPRAAHLDRRPYERIFELHDAEIRLCTSEEQLVEMARFFLQHITESKKGDPMCSYWIRLRIRVQLRAAGIREARGEWQNM